MDIKQILKDECATKKTYGELYSKTLLTRQMMQEKIKQFQADGMDIAFDGHGVWMLKSKEEKLSARQLKNYTALLEVPESITKDMTHFTKDPAPIEDYRDRIARAIARLNRL